MRRNVCDKPVLGYRVTVSDQAGKVLYRGEFWIREACERVEQEDKARIKLTRLLRDDFPGAWGKITEITERGQ
jgi:hypothetical protein